MSELLPTFGRPTMAMRTSPSRRLGAVFGAGGSALMTVRSLESADVGLLVVDATEGVTDQDAHVAAEICERGCAVVVLANKWDLVPSEKDEPGAARRLTEQISHGLRFLPDVPIVPVSAKTGARVARILPAARKATAAGSRKIATADLNRWLQQVVRMHEPPVDRIQPLERLCAHLRHRRSAQAPVPACDLAE